MEEEQMAKAKNQTAKENKYKFKVTKNGPYLVSGGVPLSEQDTCVDNEDQCHGWKEGQKYATQESYALCRCGHSQHKPYCDGSHAKVRFDGTETAENKPYMERASEVNGPGLKLTDVQELCVGARFCHRDGGPWKLTKESGNAKAKQTVIEETCDCPSGRLVAWEKEGKAIEPDMEPSIGLVNDTQAKKMGPIWVRGGIPVESADGKTYEVRNRVTLCRCGKSSNKPFCDGSHLK
jgi:CDGSH-type Zn-finger protein